MTEERFYFNGLFYKNECEFLKAVHDYTASKISPISAEACLHEMCKSILLHLFMTTGEGKISNGQLKIICEETVNFFINKYQSLPLDTNDD